MLFQESDLSTQPDTVSAPQSADLSSSSSAPQQTEPDTAEAQSGANKEAQEAAEAANGDDIEAAASADLDPWAEQPPGFMQELNFKDALHKLLMWAPVKDPQIAALYASYEASQQRPASAIK